MNKTRIKIRSLLLQLLMMVGVGEIWADDLTEGYIVSGYESYNKTFFNFKTNTPAVLPTTGDLRYRESFGLHNFGSGTRSAVVSIPVAAGDLLVLQQYNDAYQTTINRGTKNDALSSSTGFQCFNITEDANDITFTTPRYGGVSAVLLFSQKYSFVVNASDWTTVLKTIATGLVSMGDPVTIAYPQYILKENTLYNIANNGSGDWFRKTITPNQNMYTETLYYTNGTISNVVYYQEGEDIPGVSQATNAARASQGKMGHTGGSYMSVTNLVGGAYRISWRGVNGNADTRQVRFKSGDTEIYSFGITNGTDRQGTSGLLNISNPALSLSCEGSGQSGLDWFYVQAVFAYKEASSSIPVGTSNYRPDMFLPDYNESAYTFTSDNEAVATVNWNGIIARNNGTATITARRTIDGVEYVTTHTVTVTGQSAATTEFDYNELTKSETYVITGNGYLPEYDDGTSINIGYGSTTEIQTSLGTLAHCEDASGFWHAHLDGSGIPDMGTYYIIRPKLGYHGKITINAYVGDDNGTRNAIRLIREDGTVQERITAIQPYTTNYSFNLELIDGQTYFLMAETPAMSGSMNNAYSNLQLHSLTFTQSSYVNTSEVIEIPASGNHSINISGTGMTAPTYSIVNKYGELESLSISINSEGLVSGITAGGVIRIGLTKDGYTCYHLLTVAYPATEYPGHLWDFNVEGVPMTTADILRTVPVPPNTALGNSGDTWTALYKVDTGSYTRAPEWRLNRAINGDNVLVVPETAGLLFNTSGSGFYMRNDDETFGHVGIHSNGASFTIPFLKEGDIVELNWKHDAGDNGSTFAATNLKDLRNKTIPTDDTFLITESAYRTKYNHPGRYSFIVAADGDVTFTLRDAGYTDILSVRIYEGPYRPTMHNIDLSGGDVAPTTVLTDNSEQEFTYNYCNPLYSTATGPAMYVIKGYEAGKGFNHGVNADKKTNDKYDNDFYWFDDPDGYPVSEEERTQLINLRKNIVGLKVENHPWKSENNAYNNGYIAATSGWGKVTIRMNNYTNDMKYVIGYTPDYTLTIGSAPHQDYPYTWDFTHISSQNERGASTNVYNSIKSQDLYNTNWTNTENGVFSLNVKNTGQFDSQYVPGAVLVTTERSLSKIRGVSGDAYYAKDELDGLGFSGKVSIDTDSKASTTRHLTRAGSSTIDLLSFTMNDYKIVNTTTEVDGETVVTDWKNNVNVDMPAGYGWVKFGADKIDESLVVACGFAYKCDYNAEAGNSDKAIFLRPARKLKNGDIITVKIYATSTPADDKRYGIGVFLDDNYTAKATMYIPNGQKNIETELSYTVRDGDGLNDQSMIKLYRMDNSVYLSEVHISGDATAEAVSREIYCETEATITVPDLNADSKQDWIYVSASEAPTNVTNATLVTTGTDGPDANTENKVYKYKVTDAGNSLLTFGLGTRIYKIGVTHILKEIHPVGGTGWATEIRKHSIDHELTGYFTKNDVNAYTVSYDSYDLKTETVGLTPINEDGYVPMKTGIVMRLDNVGGLSDANDGKNVPLFYPSYTRSETTTSVDFPTNNRMYNVEDGIDSDNRNYNEVISKDDVNYTKFILTNKYWTFNKDHTLGTDESATYHTADAAGFYRMHIWKTGDDVAAKNTMPAHTAWLLVPSDNLPAAVWTMQEGYAAVRDGRLGVYNITAEGSETAIGGERIVGCELDNGLPWYTISGMKLNAPPTQPGFYIHGGRKVIIK